MFGASEPRIYIRLVLKLVFGLEYFLGFHRVRLLGLFALLSPNLNLWAQFTYWAEVVFEHHLGGKNCDTCAGLKFFSYIYK